MANKEVFLSATLTKKKGPVTDAVNEAGGKAYQYSAEHELAQYAMTGTFNDAFYNTGAAQLERMHELCKKVDTKFIAQLALFSRANGHMKDMPAFLCVFLLAQHDSTARSYLDQVFDRVIDNGRMLRNFVQIVRSGVTGKKSLGSTGKRLVRRWFDQRDCEKIYFNSIGNDPSMKDVIKLARPKPKDDERRAFYGYMIGRDDYKKRSLPKFLRDLEKFKLDRESGENRMELPKAPLEVLQGFKLSDADWTEIARRASWTQTRMNLNTFARHGVFKDREMVDLVVERLTDKTLIEKAKVFPYQLMMAFTACDDSVPTKVRDALQDAMELAVANVDVFDDIGTNVCVDVSGSMSSPATGHRHGATTAVRCIDIAALVGAIVLRKNSNSTVVPFEGSVRKLKLNGRDSIMTNAQKLAGIGGGSTNCSAALAELNATKSENELVIYVSDNESWVDSSHYGRYGGNSTMTMAEWAKYKKRVPNAKMVCIDIQANGTTQAKESKDILNVGGFSDSVFDTIARFVGRRPRSFVEEIKATKL